MQPQRELAPPIAIPGDLLAAIYAHAIAEFPSECCGYLIGAAADRADGVVACHNAQTTGAHPLVPERGADTGFVIDGRELFELARSFDGDRPARVVYHSHTNGRAYFSSVDRAMAAGPAYPVQHLVVGVTGGAITEAAQFAWSDAARDYVEIARWAARDHTTGAGA